MGAIAGRLRRLGGPGPWVVTMDFLRRHPSENGGEKAAIFTDAFFDAPILEGGSSVAAVEGRGSALRRTKRVERIIRQL